uniref:uncharacterized protein n=1 Tax=Myxine glutinosa TaxID=7769 RepID=UPI00358FF85E
MLKMTKQDLDLITDVDMLLMIEKAKRGGISQVCSSRYAKANNKYLPNYDPTKESSYLMYYDANNLYGWAMSQALPYGKLRWVKEKDYKNVLQDVCISTQKELDEEKVGYYFEIDLKYPEELHNLHKDLPFACEKASPKKEWLSDYQRSFDIGESTEKLLTTLYNKKNYVLHQRNLRQYLSKGLRVEKIHRVLKFNQSHWLKGYIDFNTQRRTESKTDFEKDFYKLMNNAVFGKTMENVRKRQNIRLSTSWEQASKLINRPSFTRAEVFTENFCAIHLIKESIEMNKPIYIGTTILDLSKSLMYDYFYNNLRKKYQNDVNLLYMDTDSFILKINTNDVYSDMKRDINIYDTSNYSPESELFSSKNKKVIGKKQHYYTTEKGKSKNLAKTAMEGTNFDGESLRQGRNMHSKQKRLIYERLTPRNVQGTHYRFTHRKINQQMFCFRQDKAKSASGFKRNDEEMRISR